MKKIFLIILMAVFFSKAATANITFVGATDVQAGLGQVTLPLPAGWQPGDLMLVMSFCPSSGASTGAMATNGSTSGWYHHPSWMWMKVMQAGEVAPTWNFPSYPGDGVQPLGATLSVWRGVDASNLNFNDPNKTVLSIGEENATECSGLSINTVAPNSVVVYCYQSEGTFSHYATESQTGGFTLTENHMSIATQYGTPQSQPTGTYGFRLGFTSALVPNTGPAGYLQWTAANDQSSPQYGNSIISWVSEVVFKPMLYAQISGIPSSLGIGPNASSMQWTAPTQYTDGSTMVSTDTLTYESGCRSNGTGTYTILASAGTSTPGVILSEPISNALPTTQDDGYYFCAVNDTDSQGTSFWSNEVGIVEESGSFAAPLATIISPNILNIASLKGLGALTAFGGSIVSLTGLASSNYMGSLTGHGNSSASPSGISGSIAFGALDSQGSGNASLIGTTGFASLGNPTGMAPGTVLLAGIINYGNSGVIASKSSAQYGVLETTDLYGHDILLQGLNGKTVTPTIIYITQ